MQFYNTIKLKTDYINFGFFLFSLSLIGFSLSNLVGRYLSKIDTTFLIAEEGVMQASHCLQRSISTFFFEPIWVENHPGYFIGELENTGIPGYLAFISNSFILGNRISYTSSPDYLQAERV